MDLPWIKNTNGLRQLNLKENEIFTLCFFIYIIFQKYFKKSSFETQKKYFRNIPREYFRNISVRSHAHRGLPFWTRWSHFKIFHDIYDDTVINMVLLTMNNFIIQTLESTQTWCYFMTCHDVVNLIQRGRLGQGRPYCVHEYTIVSPCLPKIVFSCPPTCKFQRLWAIKKGQKYTNFAILMTI